MKSREAYDLLLSTRVFLFYLILRGKNRYVNPKILDLHFLFYRQILQSLRSYTYLNITQLSHFD